MEAAIMKAQRKAIQYDLRPRDRSVDHSCQLLRSRKINERD